MATIVKLTRQNAAQPWGFRIHGGRDFNQPIIVLKVTAGTLAASSGLTPGDQLASINGRDAASLNHKDAENLIKNAGNEVAIGVYKANQSTWKPNVTVLNQPTPQGESGSVLVNKQFNTPIAMYSEQSIAETLSAQAEVLAGGAIGVNFKKNEKKYNYENSEVYKMLQEAESDRDSSSSSQQQQQQDSYNAPSVSPGRTSASFVTNQNVPYANVLNRQQQFQPVVQQMQQQQIPQQQIQQQQIPQQQIQQQQPIQQQQQSPAAPAAAPAAAAAAAAPIQQVTAPVTSSAPPAAGGGGSNPNVCADCERLIVGVFVRIKDKNLHVDCFKCSTCGQSLKNVGYFNINNKLYCDIHAKTVARQNPPAPGLEPLTKTPQLPLTPAAAAAAAGTKPFSYTAAAAPGLPAGLQMSPLPALPPLVDSYASKMAPLPFHQSPSSAGGGGISHVTAPKSPQQQQQQQPLYQPQQQLQQLQQIVPLQQQQQQQQQQLIQQSSSSSTYQESVYKSSSSSYVESSSQGGVSKVTWPPSDIIPSTPPPSSKIQQQQQQKFKQQHVPYQPLASLLQPAQNQQQQQQPKFSPVAAPPQQQQQQQQQFAPFQPAPPPSAAPIQFSPILPPQPQQQQFAAPPPQQQPIFAPQQQQQQQPGGGGGPSPRPLPVFPIAPAPGPAAINAASQKTTTSSTLASRIGRGILTQPGGPRVAVCGACQKQIRGPFVTAGLKFYCPDHFKCANGSCGRDLMEIGFVEEGNALYCEFCWEAHIAPQCGKCGKRIKNECIKAIGREFHPQCFTCKQCNRAFGKDPFFLEDGEPFCQADWNEMFTTKCHGCGFPIEAGDRWVEAMSNNYHSQCFNCSACKKNLEGQSFFAKAGRPFCKSHAR